MKNILVLAGPSAVGKTTVMKEILSGNSRFEYIRSATTRAPRGDGHDSEYLYLSEEEFRERASRGEMLEYTEFGGNLYGTPNSEIERIFKNGKIPLLILDINGVSSLKSAPRSFGVFAAYIWDDIKVIEHRLYERMLADKSNPKALETFERRKQANIRDYSRMPEISYLFDAFVKNTDIAETAIEIISEFDKHPVSK